MANNKNYEFSYVKLWKILLDKNMIKKDLMKEASLTSTTMAKMGKGEAVSMETLGRICECLNCNLGDIVDYSHKVKGGGSVK